MLKKFFIILTVFFLFSCSGTQNSKNNNQDNQGQKPEEMYIIAKNSFDSSNYILANEQFIEITKLYPLSNEAIQSEIMLGFISYLILDYDSATLDLSKEKHSLRNYEFRTLIYNISNSFLKKYDGLDGWTIPSSVFNSRGVWPDSNKSL